MWWTFILDTSFYIYAKPKAIGKLRSKPMRPVPVDQCTNALATIKAKRSYHNLGVHPSVATIAGGKCQGSHIDPDEGLQKQLRYTGLPFEEVP